MSPTDIYKAWAILLALSFATTAMTLYDGSSPSVIAAALLALAGLKARTILARYLELQRSPFWMNAFDLVIGIFLLIAFALYLAAEGGGR